MHLETSLTTAQHVVRICLFLFTAIALFGGMLQMKLGQPDTSPRLDNVHRFMAGIYLGTGVICLWAALNVRQQGRLIDLIALGVLLGGLGRLWSIAKVGLPKPRGVWLAYLLPELVLPFVVVIARHAG